MLDKHLKSINFDFLPWSLKQDFGVAANGAHVCVAEGKEVKDGEKFIIFN